MDIREAIIYKNIFGGGDGSNAMVEHKLTYNGTTIKFGDTTQTFAEVKSACDDATKFVFLVYENRLYIPQYVTASAIYFTCTYPTDTMGVMTRRITMMSNNTITVNNTELQTKLTAGENISIVDNVISATGGGGEAKAMTLLAEIDFETAGVVSVQLTNLQDITELYIENIGLRNDTGTASAFWAYINDVCVSEAFLAIGNGGDTKYNYAKLSWNGVKWEAFRSAQTINNEYMRFSSSGEHMYTLSTQSVDKASSIKLACPNDDYAPTHGVLKIYGR